MADLFGLCSLLLLSTHFVHFKALQVFSECFFSAVNTLLNKMMDAILGIFWQTSGGFCTLHPWGFSHYQSHETINFCCWRYLLKTISSHSFVQFFLIVISPWETILDEKCCIHNRTSQYNLHDGDSLWANDGQKRRCGKRPRRTAQKLVSLVFSWSSLFFCIKLPLTRNSFLGQLYRHHHMKLCPPESWGWKASQLQLHTHFWPFSARLPYYYFEEQGARRCREWKQFNPITILSSCYIHWIALCRDTKNILWPRRFTGHSEISLLMALFWISRL